MRSIRENLRTISYLPGVRNVDRYGENLSAEAWETIGQIYNNLNANVDISEIYLVPVTLDPDKIGQAAPVAVPAPAPAGDQAAPDAPAPAKAPAE